MYSSPFFFRRPPHPAKVQCHSVCQAVVKKNDWNNQAILGVYWVKYHQAYKPVIREEARDVRVKGRKELLVCYVGCCISLGRCLRC